MKTKQGTWQSIRRNELRDELVHDPYKAAGKWPEPTVCPSCGLVYTRGRWTEAEGPPSAHRTACPACRRIEEHYPAGYVSLQGPFFAAHREEVLRLVRNVESRERAEHPLQRIMDIADEDGGVVVTTTDGHLARGIADAVEHAYKGEMAFSYNPEENLVRASWRR